MCILEDLRPPFFEYTHDSRVPEWSVSYHKRSIAGILELVDEIDFASAKGMISQ